MKRRKIALTTFSACWYIVLRWSQPFNFLGRSYLHQSSDQRSSSGISAAGEQNRIYHHCHNVLGSWRSWWSELISKFSSITLCTNCTELNMGCPGAYVCILAWFPFFLGKEMDLQLIFTKEIPILSTSALSVLVTQIPGTVAALISSFR